MPATTTGAIFHLVQVTETLDLGVEFTGADEPKITHQLNSTNSTQYSPNTTIVAADVWADTVTLSGGTATIDLTSLSRSPLSTVDMSSLKPLAVHFQAASANTSPIEIEPGASNGYAYFGENIYLAPGSEVVMKIPAGTAIDSTHKTLTITSADTDAKLNILIWCRVA